jgi:hypothetical protein
MRRAGGSHAAKLCSIVRQDFEPFPLPFLLDWSLGEGDL